MTRSATASALYSLSAKEHLMDTRSMAACLLFLGTGHALADPLPLRHGAYVSVDTDCKDSPNAELRDYDGKGLGSSKAGDCRARVLSRQGNVFQIEQDCQQYGAPNLGRATNRATVRVDGPDRYTEMTGDRNGSFRFCPGPRP